MWHKTLSLFFIGVLVGVIILELEDVGDFVELQEDPVGYLYNSYSLSSDIGKIGYYALLAILLPFVAIAPLKKRLTEKHLKVYSFLSGITFAFSVATIISILTG